ncbi:MAG: type II toxin-antitoxin system VapC family toxin [Gammaproteobacteria bacterium]
MKAADSSVVVAGFASWHSEHEAARRALDAGLRLIDHCALETFSVLTRLPPPHRVAAVLVREFLAARFPQPYLRLDEPAFRAFVGGLDAMGIAGGSVYDALVAATAAAYGIELVTCDRRALPTYERYGVMVKLLA